MAVVNCENKLVFFIKKEDQEYIKERLAEMVSKKDIEYKTTNIILLKAWAFVYRNRHKKISMVETSNYIELEATD